MTKQCYVVAMKSEAECQPNNGPLAIDQVENEEREIIVIEETVTVTVDPSDPNKTVIVGNVLSEEEKSELGVSKG